MRAELKSLFSMEIPGGLEGYTPDDPAHFGIRVMAFIGTPGNDKVDSFDLCAHWEAADWGTLANRIGWHIPWEFDDHYDAFVDERASSWPAFPPGEQP